MLREGNLQQPRVEAFDVDNRATKDAALVLAAKGGDALAFEALVRRHQRTMLTVALRVVRVREDAEDVVQQSLHKAYTHLHRFEGKSAFSTWLTRIAINESLMLLRKRRGSREIPIENPHGTEETLEMEVPDSAPGPEKRHLRREQRRILSAAMKELKPGLRTAIQLRELGELSTEETARTLGLSVAAVKARVFHARRKLRKALRRYVLESTWTQRNETSSASRNANRISLYQFV